MSLRLKITTYVIGYGNHNDSLNTSSDRCSFLPYCRSPDDEATHTLMRTGRCQTSNVGCGLLTLCVCVVKAFCTSLSVDYVKLKLKTTDYTFLYTFTVDFVIFV